MAPAQKMQVMDLIDLGAAGARPQDIDALLDNIRYRFGFDHAAYAGSNPIAGTIHAYVTYPDQWKQVYLDQNLHLYDPTLAAAGRSIAPVDWARLERTQNFDRVFRSASDFGIAPQGLTIPVRGPYGDIGMLSVTRNCAQTEWEQHIPQIISDLQSIAVHIHDGAMRSHTLMRALRAPNLSLREIEILQWIAAGKTQQDVGDILGISHRTVEVHLRSGRDKLYALTTAQAVARAIAMGMIYPL
jgi:DNA-binding CsgD family transcriptional regulator